MIWSRRKIQQKTLERRMRMGQYVRALMMILNLRASAFIRVRNKGFGRASKNLN
jgi:hypothetical protein